ncbi:Aste57867_14038 [Aphanomyces stellatus]|uniref:Aste57867_14038 protein n=1 Tax=Aphanomyces stellatus TaxID=120398 RepID=A0A485KZM8_9STRA|nr:hypothetical protein As57867_013987 [Aphanomyces stellatus]VFT90868.1 Aste57867_14038 [Aphanomyces stellatus]
MRHAATEVAPRHKYLVDHGARMEIPPPGQEHHPQLVGHKIELRGAPKGPNFAAFAFKAWARLPVLGLVSFLRLVCAAHLVVMALIYFLASDRQVALLHMWPPQLLVGVVYMALALFHLAQLGSTLIDEIPRSHRRRSRKDEKGQQGSGFRTRSQLWLALDTLVEPYETLSAAFLWCTSFDSLLVTNQVVSVVAQTWQAYHVSTGLTNPSVALAYAVLVGLHCLAIPWCVRAPLLAVRTTLVLTTHLIFSFVVTTVIPLVYIVPVVVSYQSSGIYGLLFSNEWLTANVFLLRVLVVHSFFDLLVKLCPIVATMHTMHELTLAMTHLVSVSRVIELKRAPSMSAISEKDEVSSAKSRHSSAFADGFSRLMASRKSTVKRPSQVHASVIAVRGRDEPTPLRSDVDASIKSKVVAAPVAAPHARPRHQPVVKLLSLTDAATLTFENKLFVGAYVALYVMWGLFVLAVAIYFASTRYMCPSYCAIQVAPWFTSTCQCAYVNLNCPQLNISGTTAEIEALLNVTSVGPHVFWLQLVRCDVGHGVSDATLAQLPLLFGLSLWQANVTLWPSPSLTSWPPLLTKLSFQHSPLLTSVPDVLSPLPPSVQVLFVVDSPISTLPDATVQSWTNLRQLWLSNLLLETLPLSMAGLRSLDELRLHNNRLVALPNAILHSMALLQTLSISSNNLTAVPWDSRNLFIDVSHNPIVAMPRDVTTDLLVGGTIAVADTPFCATSMKANPLKWQTVCAPPCSPHCAASLLKNGLCDISCLLPQCQYDLGDCAEFTMLQNWKWGI